MNKIFKVIWHHATQSWVVTSELSKAHGKTASTATAGESNLQINGIYKAGFVYTAIASAILMVSGQAFATNIIAGNATGNATPNCFYNDDSQSVVCGDATTTTAIRYDTKTAKSVVVGKGATNNGESNVAVGVSSASKGTASIAIGSEAKANFDQTVAIGQNAEGNGRWDISIGRFAGQGATPPAVKQGDDPKTAEGRNIAIGDGALKDAKNVNNNTVLGTSAGQGMSGSHNIVMGAYANSKTVQSSGVNVNNVVAIGERAAALSSSNIAIGNRVKASGSIALAFGASAEASGNYSIATGYAAKTSGVSSIAIGSAQNTPNQTRATANYATAIGFAANAGAEGAIAIGRQANHNPAGEAADPNQTTSNDRAKTTGENSIAVGTDTHASKESAIAIGARSTTLANQGIAIGDTAKVEEKGLEAIPAPKGAYTTQEIYSKNAIAIGKESTARGVGSIALGAHSETRFMNATAVGNETKALGYNSTAMGFQALAKGVSSIAIGDKALAGAQDPNTHIPSANRGIAIGVNSNATGETAVTIGSNSEAAVSRGTALGVLSQVTQRDGVALGSNSTANRAAGETGVDPLSARETATANSVWVATHAAVSIGTDAQHQSTRKGNAAKGIEWTIPVVTRQITNVAAGSADSDAVNVAQLKAAGFVLKTAEEGGKATNNTPANATATTDNKIANGESLTLKAGKGVILNQNGAEVTIATDISAADKTHYYSVNTTDTGDETNFNNDGAKAIDSVAAGVRVKTTQKNSVAVGSDVLADGAESLAVGNKVKAIGLGATAIGNNSKAEAEGAQAFGQSSEATAQNAAAIGRYARATAKRASAFGVGNLASGESSFAGGDRSVASGERSIAVGLEAKSTHSNTIAIGSNAVAQIEDSIAIGRGVTTEILPADNALANNGVGDREGMIAIGSETTKASGKAAVSIGRNAQGIGRGTVALGDASKALEGQGVAVGAQANVTKGAAGGIAIGSLAKSEKHVAIAIGSESLAKGDKSVSVGSKSSVDSERGIAVGYGAKALGAETANIAIGDSAYTNASGAVVIGKNTSAKGLDGVTTPNGNKASPYNAIAIGTGANVDTILSADPTKQERSTDAIAIGTGARAQYASTIAIGFGATANTKSSATAIGLNSDAQGWKSLALGVEAVASQTDSVALGSNSVANIGFNKVGVDPLNAKEIGSADSAVWKSTKAAVSVGNVAANITRQITSVAAGTEDTDAVNVAQLKAAGFVLDTAATSEGELGTKTVDTTKKEADDKVQNGETVTIEADKNIKVTQTAAKVTIATKDDVKFTSVTTGNTVMNNDGITIKAPANQQGPNPTTDVKLTANGLDNGGNSITNVKGNLPETTNGDKTANPIGNTTAQTAPANVNDIKNNAATVGDILNAGFNLQTNNAALDFVKAYDTLNFKNGVNTKVRATTDGTTNNLFVDVVGLPIQYTTADGRPVAKVGDEYYALDDNGVPCFKCTKPEDFVASVINPKDSGPKKAGSATKLANVQGNLQQVKADGQVNNPNGTEVKAASLDNLKAGPQTAEEIKTLRDTPKSANYAATLGDVLNSGWNLQGNGAAKDFVRHADTVNFVDGTGTTVEVETTPDGTTSTVKVNTLVELVDAEGNPVKKANDGKFYPKDQVNADGSLKDPNTATAVTNPQVNLVNPTATAGNETKSPIQLGNLAAGTNTLDGTSTLEGKPLVKVGDDYYRPEDLDANGKPLPGKNNVPVVTPPNPDSAFAGLADLATSNPNNAVTVSDLRKMGWVLSGQAEDGSDYAKAIKNADQVKFVGKGLANVTIGQNAETGAQEITFDVKQGEVIKEGEGTATVGGEKVDVVKVGNDYYKKSDIDPTTGQPKPGTSPITPDAGTTIVNNGDGLVTGHKVAEAIQKSSWTVGKAEAEEAFEVTYTNADEKVNPNDNVRFADGKNTVASLGTVKKLDADGKVVTTTVVKVDVDLPVDFKYTDATGKEYVKANDGKFYAKNEVGVDGFPSINAQPLTDDQVSELKKGAQLTDGVNANGQPNNGYTAKDPIQVAVQQAAEKAVKDTLAADPAATPETIAAAVKTATDKARVEAIKANPEAKDTVTAGTGGVNLDNVAWAEKPDQAVNKDQLDQTVNKSGFFVEQNGKSTIAGQPTEKVTPNDTVNFANGANTLVTAETKRDEATGADKTTVTVNVNGLPLTYTTKDATGKDVPVAKVGDKFYQVGADGKPDMTKPADVNSLSTNLVNPAAPNGEIGKPSQLGNVANGANTFNAPVVEGEKIKLANDGKWYKESDVGANGKPTDTATAIDPAKAAEALKATPNGGLVDFEKSNPNNAATVGDLQNLGFSIGTSENGYTDQVRNNAKVDFVGDKKFITVKGSTNKETGAREIKISLKEGDVIKPNEGIATIDGQKTEVVKTPDGNYYKKSDIDPTTGEPKPGVSALTPEQVKTVQNNGDGLVTGHKVAEALQKSGWTVGKADAAEAANVDYNNKSEKVNPDDKVSFADGKNTQVSLGTVKQEDKDGKVVTTTTVKVDVDLPIDFKYTDATGKEFVKANDGKIYAKDQVGADGKPNGNATPLADAEVAKLNKGAQLTNGLGKETPKYEVKDPIAAAAEKAVADTLAANPQATPADILKAVDAAKAAAIKANPNAKDEITKGTGGVNLDNVAWAEKPDQAVNKDQLDQTVNKSGFFVQQNGESTNGKGKPTEKVTPNDVVDFTNGANTLVTAETTRNEKGVDTTKVSVHVNGLPLTYTTKDASGKDVPVAKVGDKFYQVGADGKPDMTKPADVNSLSTNLVNPAAPNGEIGKPSQLGNVANGANTFVAPQVDGKDIKLANDGKWYAADQVDPNGSAKANAKAIDAAKAKDALGTAGNGGLADFANSNPNNAATVGDLQNLGFVIGTADDKYKDQVRNNSRVEFASGNKNATVTGSTLADGTRQVKVTISDNPVFNTIQVGGDKGPKVGSTSTGDLSVSKADGSAARITNVAPGVNGTDAVNVNQLNQGLGDVHKRINKTNKDLRGGIAGSNAAAGLPQVYLPGKSMVAAAAGTYKGESAVAVGYSRASDNGKVILKLQGNANTRGDFGGSVGVGYQW